MSTKKRMTIRTGIIMGMQEIDEDTGAVLSDYVVNTWGGEYFRLEQEEAILFQQFLNEKCGKDFDALSAKVRDAAVEFGTTAILGEEKKVPPGQAKKR
jgi:agmatine/peptidylarginine deiminase